MMSATSLPHHQAMMIPMSEMVDSGSEKSYLHHLTRAAAGKHSTHFR
jgi:hypothetical protein